MIYPYDKLEFKRVYQMEIKFPGTLWLNRVFIKYDIDKKLWDMSVDVGWKIEFLDTDFIEYSLKSDIELTHKEVLDVIQSVYPSASRIGFPTDLGALYEPSLPDIPEIPPIGQSIKEWWADNWEIITIILTGGIYYLIKGEKLTDWIEDEPWRALIIVVIVAILAFSAYSYIKKPTVIVVKK